MEDVAWHRLLLLWWEEEGNPLPRQGRRRPCALHRPVPAVHFAGVFAVRAVLLSVLVRPTMLGITAGMFQKDRYVVRCRAHRRLLQWHVHGWFTGIILLALSSFLLWSGPRCSASWPVHRTDSCAAGWFYCDDAPRAVLPLLVVRLDARHHGRYGSEGQLPREYR